MPRMKRAVSDAFTQERRPQALRHWLYSNMPDDAEHRIDRQVEQHARQRERVTQEHADPQSAEACDLERMEDEQRERPHALVTVMKAVNVTKSDGDVSNAMRDVHSKVHHQEQDQRVEERTQY